MTNGAGISLLRCDYYTHPQFVQKFDKGGIQIDTVQGTPDINGLEDVLFHVKRLGSAVGVAPSLLGFGDMLSGGLGDGGFSACLLWPLSRWLFCGRR